jgi:hypothetical protein
MIITRSHLSRRAVLRGLGTAVSLPLLDAMVPALTAQDRTAAKAPLRFGAVYFPHGVNAPWWIPATEGRDFDFPLVLKSLEPFRSQLTVVSGLDQPNISIHLTASASFLNGAPPKKTESEDVGSDVTLDQLVAARIAGDTPFPSLELGTEDMSGSIGACEGGYSCLYFNVLSWRTKSSPLPMELNPRALFERMFGDSGQAQGRLERMRYRRSVLDAITEGARRLQRQLGASDQHVLADFLDNVREVEQQIQKAEQRLGSNPDLPPAPAGIPDSYDEHVKLMYDLAALALQADLTRVFTFMVSHEGSQIPYPQVGVTEGHHSVSHHRDDPERMAAWGRIGTYHAELFARFLEKLRATPDGDGNLLDHSMVLYGSGLSNANVHAKNDLPCLVAGGAGGRHGGNRHLRYPRATPWSNLLVALGQKAGLEVERIGVSNGTVDL